MSLSAGEQLVSSRERREIVSSYDQPVASDDTARRDYLSAESPTLAPSGEALVPVTGIYVVSLIYVGGGLLLASHVELVLVAYLVLGFGLVLALVGLYALHDSFHDLCVEGRKRAVDGPTDEATKDLKVRSRSRGCAAIGLVGYVAGGVAIALAVVLGSGALGLVGTWVTAAALAAISAGLRRLLKPKPQVSAGDLWRTAMWTVVGVAVVAVSLFAVAVFVDSDVRLTMAALVVVLGMVVASLGLQRLCRTTPNAWMIIGLGLIGAAGAFLAVGALWLSFGLLAVIGLLLLVGLGLVVVSKSVPYLEEVRTRRWWGYLTTFFIGMSVAVILTVTFSRSAWPFSWTVGVVILASLLAAALVFDGVELAVLLTLGVALSAVIADRVESAPLAPTAEADERIVAFGDSYISGEGALRFFPGTNVRDVNECRRAATAYPYLVADALDMDLDFYACSGATARHVYEESHQRHSPDNVVGKKPQLGNLSVNDAAISAVLVSIGGNDAWFGTIGQACFAPGSCAVHRTTILLNVASIGQRVTEAYSRIKAEVGDDVPIVAMPYPLTTTETGCDSSPFTEEEHEFVVELTEVLNDRARASAAQVGINWFEPGIDAFAGGRICEANSADAVVNVVDLTPQQGSLMDRLLPINWIHGSAHPDPRGHELMAKELQPYLEGLLAAVKKGEQANPDPRNVEFQVVSASPSHRVSTRLLSLPEDLACPPSELTGSAEATRIPLGGERRLNQRKPGSPVCATLPNGDWDVQTASEDGSAVVRIWGADVAEDDAAATAAPSQIMISQDTEESWTVFVFEFCALDPDCAEDENAIKAWMYSQISNAAATAAIPALLIFIGAWFLAVDVRRS